METTSLYYFSELAKDLNMTHTASRLYISQQTLSNHIIRLEEQLGTKLFERKPTLRLTSSGEVVLQFANMVNRGYANLQDMLAEIEHEERGAISFGASFFQLHLIIPQILPLFTEKFPKVQMRLSSMNSSHLEQSLLSGDIDLALVSDLKENPLIASERIFEDIAYLCVRKSLLEQYYGENADKIIQRSSEHLQLADFSSLPFCPLQTRVGNRITEGFSDAHFQPKCYMRTTDVLIVLDAFCTQPMAGFSTHSVLVRYKKRLPEDLLIFPYEYKGKTLKSSFYLCHHKERYLADYAVCFSELVRSFFTRIASINPLE